MKLSFEYCHFDILLFRKGRSEHSRKRRKSRSQENTFSSSGISYGDYDGTPMMNTNNINPWMEMDPGSGQHQGMMSGADNTNMMPDNNMMTAMNMNNFLQCNNIVMGDNNQFVPPWMGSGGSNYQMDQSSCRQPVTFNFCVIYPPNPNSQPPSLRERPPGCRTVFIGGLPETITEEIILDVFSKCGEIQAVRPSKKNFCHIRFTSEQSVDNALFFSGWRMKIDNSSLAENSGKLHVDFANARDDQYEWECHQRAMERKARQMMSLAQPPSPPPIPNFSELEAGSVIDQIKSDNTGDDDTDNWNHTIDVLLTWLERGDCNKKNSHNFYSMIQAVRGHYKRLTGEKVIFQFNMLKH